MVTSWHGNGFCVTDPLCEGLMDFPQRGRFEELWCSIVVNLNKLLNKKSSWRWFETSWRSCDINIVCYESVWTSGTQTTPWVNYRHDSTSRHGTDKTSSEPDRYCCTWENFKSHYMLRNTHLGLYISLFFLVTQICKMSIPFFTRNHE